MTVITVTAVGYSEVFDLSPTGRTFTMFLLLSGISWMGFWFANITSFIVELDLKDVLKRRRTMQDIAKMKDHIVICGAGRTGRQVAQEVQSVTQDFVIIERDPARIEQLAEYVPDARVLERSCGSAHDRSPSVRGRVRRQAVPRRSRPSRESQCQCRSANGVGAA
jgi:voltage-gated potassium channel Kch